MKAALTVSRLLQAANEFARRESRHRESSLFGVTDGKAVGTYLEQKFQAVVREKYQCLTGSAAKGIDFPELDIDIKVTSIKQPQSSCPFRSARQKIYGLGYSLLVFMYSKSDNRKSQTATLDIEHVVFVEASRTADFQTTSGILKIVENAGNVDDLMAFMAERFLPLDEIAARQLAEEILLAPPNLGYLTISNALQWRLQYARVLEQAGKVSGVKRVL
jgi:hypothetical protein